MTRPAAALALMAALTACDAGDGQGRADAQPAHDQARRVTRPSAPGLAAPPTGDIVADPGSPSVAQAVVERYFDLLVARRHGESDALWRRGRVVEARDMAAFLGRLTGLTARVGRPFDADAGAGQRYITVPATVRGTDGRGTAVTLEGTVVLHRVADGIDTDDPADHRWQIDRLVMTPRRSR